MPFGPGQKIGDGDISGLPEHPGELREVFARTDYMVPIVRAWAIEHAEGIWKAMYAYRFQTQDDAKAS